jgi:phenylalanyl-tRNA synthetase beta chain
MNIKIIDSWLREYLETEAKPSDIAKQLSLTSVSVEKTETIGNEIVYDIEVTTNRPDLMSVRGIAQEAAAVLPEEGIKAKYIGKTAPSVNQPDISFPIEIVNDPALVNRIMAVVMEVEIGPSPKEISTRLEQSGIRSLNNLIDVTNYVMREIGHPCHVFDYDLINTKKMIIRKSKEGEELTTLDGKKYRLSGGDIVADNGRGEIIDLLGVMGTANSVVQDNTKRILFFLDNNNSRLIRQTSMNLGIRTEAAIINEKGIDPELMEQAFRRGVELYKQIAKGKVVTKTLDIYPNKSKPQNIKVNIEKINNLIGVEIPPAKSEEILKKLGFGVKKTGNVLDVEVPTVRADEVLIPEDIIEEIARVYGYHKLPCVIPGFLNNKTKSFGNEFYFEKRIKNALKYWGYTEVYTYSLVSEDMFQGPIETAVKLKNPLTNDMEYMRNSLIPSLLKVIEDNKSREVVRIFELANVYHKKSNDLPEEKLMLAGAVKKTNVSFYDVKGVIEQLLTDLGIKNYKFKERGEPGADIFIGSDKLGYIEILNSNIVDFELSFEIILKHATLKKVYKPLAKFPPVVEDITFVLGEGIKTEDVAEEIKLQSFLIREVTLKDQFENSKTFHIIYQAEDKNLTNTEVTEIRNSIIKAISEKFDATVK